MVRRLGPLSYSLLFNSRNGRHVVGSRLLGIAKSSRRNHELLLLVLILSMIAWLEESARGVLADREGADQDRGQGLVYLVLLHALGVVSMVQEAI